MRYFFLIVVIAAALGIAYYFGRTRSGPYEIGIRNLTGMTIHGASVRTDAFVASSMGDVVNGGQSTEGLFYGQVPDKAEVMWTSGDGHANSVVVPLAGLVPTRFKGLVYFKIHPDSTVSVEPLVRP